MQNPTAMLHLNVVTEKPSIQTRDTPPPWCWLYPPTFWADETPLSSDKRNQKGVTAPPPPGGKNARFD